MNKSIYKRHVEEVCMELQVLEDNGAPDYQKAREEIVETALLHAVTTGKVLVFNEIIKYNSGSEQLIKLAREAIISLVPTTDETNPTKS